MTHRCLGLFAAATLFALVLSTTAPAHASTYTVWHPNCADSASASDKAECVRIKVELWNREDNSIKWDRIHASINADQCRITLVNGGTKVIAGKQELDVSSANWDDVGRIWFMPKACPVQVHARHPVTFGKDDIYYFNFDSVKTENDVCWKLDWYYGTQADC